MHFKGSLPLLILHVLAEGPSHGYAIASAIRERSGEVLAFREGTLYPTLHGLEQRGLITAIEEHDADGRVRRRYRLTEAGQHALAQERAAWRRYSQAVAAVLGEPVGGTT